MKSSGSIWLVYGVAVVVTFLIGLLSFGVFVLSKVFGSAPPDPQPTPSPTIQAIDTPTPRPTAVPKATAARVYEVRRVAADERQVVVVVATPVGCARNLRASTYAEGPGAVAFRVTQQAYKTGCPWTRKPVLATARTPIAERALIINGAVWTRTPTGRYEPALTSQPSTRTTAR